VDTSEVDPFVELRASLGRLLDRLAVRRQRDVDTWDRTLADRVENRLYDVEGELFDAVGTIRRYRSRVEHALLSAWTTHFAWVDIAASWLHLLNERLASDAATSTTSDRFALAHAEVSLRAVSVSHEIHALLQAGFPRGAHARWRTLFELSVVSEVLLLGGRWACTRYLNHRDLQIAQQAEDLLPNISDVELRSIESKRRQLIRRYGPTFAGRYGWASNLTKRKLGEPNPTFGHLRKLAPQASRWSAHLQVAHHDVHADPVGNALLRAKDGFVHPGATSTRELGVIAASTIGCATEIAISMCTAYEERHPYKLWLTAARFTSFELQAVGVRDALSVFPREEHLDELFPHG
jgi:Family of unknown function (DUF5677)